MQDGDGSSTSTVVEPSSTESLSTQTDEPITSRHQTSVDDSASNLSELEISTLLQIQSSQMIPLPTQPPNVEVFLDFRFSHIKLSPTIPPNFFEFRFFGKPILPNTP